MRVSRGLKGFSMYRVDRDKGVVFVDLQVAGAENISPTSRYRPYFEILEETVRENGFDTKGLRHEDYACRLKIAVAPGGRRNRNSLLLFRLYLDGRGRVRYAAMVAFRSGIFSRLDTYLQNAGWKRVFHVEITIERASTV